METVIAASLLAADFSSLKDEIHRVKSAGADWLHYDVMDGLFVPSISFGEPVLKSIAAKTGMPIDVHLMIEEPIRYIKSYAVPNVNTITVHYEAAKDIPTTLKQIRACGCKAGLSVKPTTDISVVKGLLEYTDMLLVMTVEPGFGGQSFMTDMLEKVRLARQLIADSKRQIRLEVDGGINDKTAPLALDCGADTLVTGSFLFKSQDMKKTIDGLRQAHKTV